MSPYGGLQFFVILAIVLLPAAILGFCGKRLRWYGMAATLVMLLLFFDTAQARLLLLAFTVWQVALCEGYLLLHRKTQVRYWLWLFLALCLAPLIAGKLGGFFPELRFLAILGISYMSFRAVQVLIEVYDGHIQSLNVPDLCYFLLFFPTISSGPIDRWQKFTQQLHAAPDAAAYRSLFRDGVWKLMTGAFMNFAVGNTIWQLWLEKLPESGFGANLLYMYGYALFMFFNFAGYSRMAEGAGALLAIRVTENFRQPFVSRDMKEFWSRWHISLSTFLRDYVYTRFCMAALRGKWFKNRRTSSYFGYFITMLLMGAWHGFCLHYIVYGLYHGVLMSVNDILDTKWKKFREWKKGKWTALGLTVVTFHLFSFGLLLFSGRIIGG